MSDVNGATQPVPVVSTADPGTGPNDSPHDRRIFWLAAGVIAAVPLILILLFIIPIPDKNGEAISLVIGGVITTGLGSVISYYFGSSAGSKAKDDTISTLAKN